MQHNGSKKRRENCNQKQVINQLKEHYETVSSSSSYSTSGGSEEDILMEEREPLDKDIIERERVFYEVLKQCKTKMEIPMYTTEQRN